MKDIVNIKERIFTKSLQLSMAGVVLLLIVIFITLVLNSLPSLKQFGLNFIIDKTWDPVFSHFGALPFLVGTLLTSGIALIICVPFSLAIAIFLGEYLSHGIFSVIFRSLLELLAAIPSVIYGLWSLFFLVPVLRNFELTFKIIPYGVGILTASIVLSVMIIPYAASIAREVISLVPDSLKEAAYSLGATRFEVVKYIVLPYTKSGIYAGIFLSLGRALGETMAVTMVIGNSNYLPNSIFAPSNTMASVIANEFSEAGSNLYLSSLIEIALLLFIVTAIINIIGKKIIIRLSGK